MYIYIVNEDQYSTFFLILDDNYDDYDEKFRLNDADWLIRLLNISENINTTLLFLL